MFRIVVCLLIGLALFAAYLAAAFPTFVLVLWQQMTGTEPEVHLTGTELDPY